MIFGLHPLILVTFLPLVGFFIILFLKAEQKNAIRWTALLTSLATFGVSLAMLSQFNPARGDLQLIYRTSWLRVGGISIDFYLGVDGLSILLVLLTTFLTPIAILSTWSAVEERVKGFMAFFLAAGNRHDWRLSGAGSGAFLYLLGIYAGADVLPHRCVGW